MASKTTETIVVCSFDCLFVFVAFWNVILATWAEGQ